MSACKEKKLGAGEQACGALLQTVPGHLSMPAQETLHTERGLRAASRWTLLTRRALKSEAQNSFYKGGRNHHSWAR